MNIKQHIEAGHYPADEKGRAVVASESGSPITIVATDGPEPFPLIGFGMSYASSWRANGAWSGMAPQDFKAAGISKADLLPPTNERAP